MGIDKRKTVDEKESRTIDLIFFFGFVSPTDFWERERAKKKTQRKINAHINQSLVAYS